MCFEPGEENQFSYPLLLGIESATFQSRVPRDTTAIIVFVLINKYSFEPFMCFEPKKKINSPTAGKWICNLPIAIPARYQSYHCSCANKWIFFWTFYVFWTKRRKLILLPPTAGNLICNLPIAIPARYQSYHCFCPNKYCFEPFMYFEPREEN